MPVQNTLNKNIRYQYSGIIIIGIKVLGFKIIRIKILGFKIIRIKILDIKPIESKSKYLGAKYSVVNTRGQNTKDKIFRSKIMEIEILFSECFTVHITATKLARYVYSINTNINFLQFLCMAAHAILSFLTSFSLIFVHYIFLGVPSCLRDTK